MNASIKGDVLQNIVQYPRLAPYRFEIPANVTLFRQGNIADAALLLEKGRLAFTGPKAS
jgi:hypothetical protein